MLHGHLTIYEGKSLLVDRTMSVSDHKSVLTAVEISALHNFLPIKLSAVISICIDCLFVQEKDWSFDEVLERK